MLSLSPLAVQYGADTPSTVAWMRLPLFGLLLQAFEPGKPDHQFTFDTLRGIESDDPVSE